MIGKVERDAHAGLSSVCVCVCASLVYILKHFFTSPPLFHKALFKCTQVFQGVFMVVE